MKGQGPGGVLHGVAGRVAGSVRSAWVSPGATAAVGRTGGADRGAEIHQRLVEGSGPLRVEQQLAQPPEPGKVAFRRAGSGDQARQHPRRVAIEDREGLIEGRGKNAAGGAAADAAQRQPAVQMARPGVGAGGTGSEQLPRPLLQAPRPHVIAEALPEQQHLLRIGGGQSRQIGEGRHPALPVGQGHGQLGLLEHHLRHPNLKGIKGFPIRRPEAIRPQFPRQVVAPVPLPPGQQRGTQLLQWQRRQRQSRQWHGLAGAKGVRHQWLGSAAPRWRVTKQRSPEEGMAALADGGCPMAPLHTLGWPGGRPSTAPQLAT